MRDGAMVDLNGVIATAHPVMTALSRGVPITLLLDLADPDGPDSREVLSTEVADLSWLRDLAFASTASSPEVSGRAAG